LQSWGLMKKGDCRAVIVQFVILLWRGFKHVKILDWNVNNPPVVFTLMRQRYLLQSFTCLARVNII
jgi:hypothetical protein